MRALCIATSWLLLTITISIAHAQTTASTLRLVKDESSVTYHLVHPLHKIEATSKDVEYRVDADVATKTIKKVLAAVDVTTFSSGNSNRDSHAMEVIDGITYPDARFVSLSVIRNGDSITVHGNLTFHGVTKEVVMNGTANWSDGKLIVKGGFDTSLSAFNIDRPSLLLIPVEDSLSFEIVAVFQLVPVTQ
ncbi:MAG: YceI family protein [bacterium]